MMLQRVHISKFSTNLALVVALLTVLAACRPESQSLPDPALKTIKRFDQPAEAIAHYRNERIPEGFDEIPVERYFDARDQIADMPRFSTQLNRTLTEAESRAIGDVNTWSELGPGNIGGRTRAFIIDPNTPSTMYAAGVAGGVWKSTDSGASWTALDDFMANLAVTALVMDPNDSDIIYAGTGEGFSNFDAVRGAGIFRTTNAGATWSRLPATNNSNFQFVNDLIISPNNSSVLYAATRTGILRTTDSGDSWLLQFNANSYGGVMDLAIRTDQVDDVIIAGVGSFGAIDAAIFRNTDAGDAGSWDQVYTQTNQGRTSVAIAPSNQDIMYAVSTEEGAGDYNLGLQEVLRSTNGGATWTVRNSNANADVNDRLLLTNYVFVACFPGQEQFFNQGWYDNVIAVDPTNPDRVWVGGIDLFRSDDGGAEWGLASMWWLNTNADAYAHADHHNITFHPDYDGVTNTTMFATGDGGLYQTDNPNASTIQPDSACFTNTTPDIVWANLNNNYGVTQFYHGTPYPDGTRYFGGTQDNGTVRGEDTVRSLDWEIVFGGDGGYTAIDPNDTNTLYYATTNFNIRKSTNGGASSSLITNGFSGDGGAFITPYTMDPSNSSRLWTGGFFRIYRTDNAGGLWNRASSSLTDNTFVSAIAVAPSNPDYVVAGRQNGRIYRTTTGTTDDSTTNWSFSTPRSNAFVSSLAFDPTDETIVYATYSNFGGNKVYRSTNGGASWTNITNDIPDIPVHSIVVHPQDSSRLYVGTDLGVFVSTDTGASWQVENTGYANVVTEWLSIQQQGCETNLFAFTHGRGAYRVPLNTLELSASEQNFNGLAGSGSFDIDTIAGCSWTAVAGENWITITNGDSGMDDGTVNFSVEANGGITQRMGTITVQDQIFTITQDAAGSCTYDINPTSASVSAAGGGGSVIVTATDGCAWTAVSNDAWITVTGGASGTGDGVVSYTTTANASSLPRSGTVTIAGETFTVNQDGATCNYGIVPTSRTVSAAGGTGEVTLTANPSDCDWTAVSNDAWITVTEGNSGTGSGTVTYNVAANTGAARSGTITIADQTFTVNQDPDCTLALSAPGDTFNADSGTGSFNVTVNDGCDWTAATPNAWITITSGNSGDGNGTVNFSVDAYTLSSTRMGEITVGDQTFSIEQNGVTCTYMVAPLNPTISNDGGTIEVTVDTNATDCDWTAVSNDGWITVTAGSSGTGSGTVTLTIDPNASGSRIGTVTIAGETVTVNQVPCQLPPTFFQALPAWPDTNTILDIIPLIECIVERSNP